MCIKTHLLKASLWCLGLLKTRGKSSNTGVPWKPQVSQCLLNVATVTSCVFQRERDTHTRDSGKRERDRQITASEKQMEERWIWGIGECLCLLKVTLVACYFLVTTLGSVVKKVGQHCLLSIFDINSMESADQLLKESEEVYLPGSCWPSVLFPEGPSLKWYGF